MYYNITFKDFYNKQLFLALQNKFAILDEKSNPYESEVYKDIITKDFKIIHKEVNPITHEEDYIEKFFYDDFLFPSIDNFSKRYLDYLARQFENPVFLDRNKIATYSTGQLEKLEKINFSIKNSEFLSYSIIERLELQIEIIIERISSNFIYPNFEIEDKLKFKLERDVLILLFTMLKNKNLIDAPYSLDLGNFIDKNFKYWNKKEKSYRHISRSNKVISNLINDNKSCKKALEKIKQIFTDDSFYNFPY